MVSSASLALAAAAGRTAGNGAEARAAGDVLALCRNGQMFAGVGAAACSVAVLQAAMRVTGLTSLWAWRHRRS